MKIIKETSRRVGTIRDYKGICNACGTPIEYDEELIVIEVEELEDRVIFVPADTLVCPECNKTIETIRVYKNMEVSKELEQLKKD